MEWKVYTTFKAQKKKNFSSIPSIKVTEKQNNNNTINSSSKIAITFATNASSVIQNNSTNNNISSNNQQAMLKRLFKQLLINMTPMRWACMATGNFNDPHYKWPGSNNVSNSDPNGNIVLNN